MMKARLENNNVIRYGSLPKRYMIGNVPHNLQVLPTSVIEELGFFDIVVPVITEYQELIPLEPSDLVGNQWIQRVRDFTAQEIIDYDEVQAELTEEIKIGTEIQDGQDAANRLKVYLKRNLSIANYKTARVQLRGVWDSLKHGDWDIALDEITTIDNANSTAITRKIKIRIEQYLNI